MCYILKLLLAKLATDTVNTFFLWLITNLGESVWKRRFIRTNLAKG